MRGAQLIGGLYVLACVVSLLLPSINARGWLGMTPDPLSGLFAVVLAMPWTLALQGAVRGSAVAGQAVVMLGMAANVGIILLLGRWLSSRRA